MPKFTYVVDRAYKLAEPVSFHPDVLLKSPSVALASGDEVVYRGPIEFEGMVRYAFTRDGAKLYSAERALLDRALDENYDELVKP